MSDVLWRRLGYMLSPQLDIYRHIGPKLKDMNVLEVGFGTGLGAMQLVPFARNVTAIDFDQNAVAFANKVMPLQADWQRLNVIDLHSSPIYQAAVMIEVLEHIPDWRKVIENIHAALIPGGALYVSARNANADLRKNELHEREWTASELRISLMEFFGVVTLWDYTLTKRQGPNSRITPLVAVATKTKGN